MRDSTQRFSNRVDNYVKYRPGYPPAVLQVLAGECGFTAETPVADVGSGTGILSRVLLEHGNPVHGVEPNAGMRAAAEPPPGRLPALHEHRRHGGSDHPAGCLRPADHRRQALHWFEPRRTRAEFARVLQPGGHVAVLWNERRLDDTPFQRAYERVLRTFGTDYAEVRHTNLDLARVQGFFDFGTFKLTVLANRQVFDLAGLQGRLLSSSYAPEETPACARSDADQAPEIFDEHQTNGTVTFDYDLNVYTGQLAPV